MLKITPVCYCFSVHSQTTRQHTGGELPLPRIRLVSGRKRERERESCEDVAVTDTFLTLSMILQGHRGRAVRGHSGARVLQRGRRVALYPTDPRERTSLPSQRSRAQRSQGTYLLVTT